MKKKKKNKDLYKVNYKEKKGKYVFFYKNQSSS